MRCLLGKRLLKVACYHREVRTLVVRLKELLFNLTVLQSRNTKTWPIVGWQNLYSANVISEMLVSAWSPRYFIVVSPVLL